MRKVLHIIDSINIGGAEKLLCNTIAELTEFTHLIVTLFPSADSSLLPPNAIHKCLNVKKITELPFKWNAYLTILKEFKPDLVHSHLYFATVFAKWLTPSFIPLVFTQHFEFSKNAEKWYYNVTEKLVSNKTQVGIAVSNAVLKDYLSATAFKGTMHIIGNYIPDNYFTNDSRTKKGGSDPLKLIAIGNIKSIKNQQFILDAFEYLKDQNVVCDIYGEGAQKTFLEKQAREHNLKVFFNGRIDDPGKVLANHDIFIMPSLTEGCPLALFEAMANRLPVIVSDIPVFHEVLDNKGRYVSLNNPAQLRSIIEAYLQNKDLVVQEGEQMRALALAKASKEVYLKKIRSLYDTMVKSH